MTGVARSVASAKMCLRRSDRFSWNNVTAPRSIFDRGAIVFIHAINSKMVSKGSGRIDDGVKIVEKYP